MDVAMYACSPPVIPRASRKVWSAHSLITSNAVVQTAVYVAASHFRQSSADKHLYKACELAVALRAEHICGPAVVACVCETEAVAEPVVNRLLAS